MVFKSGLDQPIRPSGSEPKLSHLVTTKSEAMTNGPSALLGS